jgi:hypothetical protein
MVAIDRDRDRVIVSKTFNFCICFIIYSPAQQTTTTTTTTTMAFDHPIEADRIDDFSLFSAFVRAPLWILGGVLGIKQHDEEDASLKPRSLNNDGDCSSSRSCSITSPPCSPIHSVSTHYPEDVNMSPSLQRTSAWTSISESNDSSSPMPPESRNPIADNADNPVVSFEGLQRTKKMSWSDESGQRLCEYAEVSEHFQSFRFICLTSRCSISFFGLSDLFLLRELYYHIEHGWLLPHV